MEGVMRDLVCAGLAAGALALVGSGAAAGGPQPKPKPRQPAAASAERFGVKAAFQTETGKGYTARERHMADCLATYRNYDPASDRIVIRPGVTRRCEL